MSSKPTNVDTEYLGPASLSHLNYQQAVLFADVWESLIEYIRRKGKNPDRNRGYSESNVRPIARRIYQVHEYTWDNGSEALTLGPDQADKFLKGLNQDKILKSNGEPYAEGSKRKFCEALEVYFRFQDINWEPKIQFSGGRATFASDPFTLEEREQLLTASLEYRSPPSYSNVSREERDRWNTYLAQVLGKPKQSIGPSDWDDLRTCWKVPCLISSALDCGWRAAMVGRLRTSLINLDEGHIQIPPDTSVKNDEHWIAELSSRSVRMIDGWLDQRGNLAKYDNSDYIWLNRKGNPYTSRTLNDLLSNLIDEAELSETGRRLTWHSIRHSTGMYVYDRHGDLEMVAEILRHASLEAARKYAHPTPESKTDVIESIQGGGL